MKSLLKRFVVFAVAITLVVSVSACSSKTPDSKQNDNATKEENSTKTDKSVTVQMAVSGSAQEIAIREATADKYMEQNSNTKIEWVDLGNERFQKLLTLISSGEAPDILYINEFVFSFAEKGVLEPLDDYIKNDKDFDLSKFYEGLIEPLKWEGKLYGLPQEVSPFVIYYNKDMFDEAGVPYPTDEWTKEEFLEMAKKLTNPEKKIYGYRHPGSDWFDQYLGWMSREGVDFYSEDLKSLKLDTPQTLNALQFLYDMVYVNKVSPDPASIQAMGKGFDALFRNQKVAMDSAGLWMLPTYKAEPLDFKWDVVRMPKGSDNQKTKAGVLNWSISKDSEKKDAAWDIIKFFVGPEGMKEVAQSSMALPASRDEQANKIVIDSKFPENVNAFVESAEELDLSDQKSSKRNEIFTTIGNEIDAMLLGEQDPKETQKKIVESGNKIMNN